MWCGLLRGFVDSVRDGWGPAGCVVAFYKGYLMGCLPTELEKELTDVGVAMCQILTIKEVRL